MKLIVVQRGGSLKKKRSLPPQKYNKLAEKYKTNNELPLCLHTCKYLLFFLFPGILYKGSGENQFISLQPPVISTVMGNGRRRSISCPSCNGQAQGNKLLAPVALAWGIDGSLYVGDFNYIRRIYPSGNVTSIMELR